MGHEAVTMLGVVVTHVQMQRWCMSVNVGEGRRALPKGKGVPDGSTRVSKNGYHYTKRGGRWILTHRLVLEDSLGRTLCQNERIKFVDGDRTNLSPNNLEVYTVRDKSPATRAAELRAKIADLEAELEELENA